MMLKDAEKEVLLSSLYIIINAKRFKEYVKEKNINLYKTIYESFETTDTLSISKQQIEKILSKNGFEIVIIIKKLQDELSKTEKPGTIGTFNDFIRMMVIHYNAIHEEEPDIQEFDLWRPKKTKK